MQNETMENTTKLDTANSGSEKSSELSLQPGIGILKQIDNRSYSTTIERLNEAIENMKKGMYDQLGIPTELF